MLYESYVERIKKISRIFDYIRKHAIIFSLAFALVIAMISLAIGFKGKTGNVSGAETFEYGEELAFKVRAFLSRAHLEYQGEDGTWTTEAPRYPGSYLVRGVGKNAAGGPRYGEASDFAILPRKAEIKVTDSSVIYGETPRVGAVLQHGDTVQCDSVRYEDITKTTTNVEPDLSSVRIFSADGDDITRAYELTAVSTSISIRPRTIGITIEDASQIYNGQKLRYDKYELSSGSLVKNDKLIATFDKYLIDAGKIQNTPTIRILNGNGKEVTHHYTINESGGTLTVEKRLLVIKTASGKATYDGNPHSYTGFTVSSDTPPLSGHRVELLTPTYYTNAGTYDNVLNFRILDGSGKDCTNNYSIVLECGKIEISKRAASVSTHSASWVYDGQAHSNPSADVAGLLTGHTYEVDKVTKITNVGTMENVLSLRIKDGNTDVTDNYSLSYTKHGTLTVTKRSLTLRAGSESWIYDGEAHLSRNIEPIPDIGDGLVASHLAIADDSTKITDVGTTQNTVLAYHIEDSFGNDVTENYTVSFRGNGTLTVTPRPILIVVDDASKVYDGKPLTSKKITVSPVPPLSFALVEGHSVTDVMTTGSQTQVGESENHLRSCRITDGNKDVTRNYEWTEEAGVLKVLERGEGGGGGGGGGSGNLDESGNLGGGGIIGDGEPSTVLKIRSNRTGNIYLRLKSFGDYTGQGFAEATPYSLGLNGAYSYLYLAGIALQNSGTEIGNLEIQSFTKQYLLPYYLSLNSGNYDMQGSDVKYEGSHNGTYSVPYLAYSGTGVGLQGYLGNFSASETNYRRFVKNQYLSVDSETRSFMQSIISKEGFSISDPNVIQRVATYIQNAATYNLMYDTALDGEQNTVVAFLSEYREGVCRHYAASATMLFRTLGIPARYTIGYLGRATANEWSEVTSMDGHAWVEVYLDGIGWIAVEVTGGSFGGDPDKPTLEIKPAYQSKSYDGTPLFAKNELEITDDLIDLLNRGYTYTVTTSGQQTKIGKGESHILAFRLCDPYGYDVTNYYNVIYSPGVLEVFSPEIQTIEIYLYQLKKYYDGTPLKFEDEDYEISEIAGGTTLNVSLNISMTDVGFLTLSSLNGNLAEYVEFKAMRGGTDVSDLFRIVFCSPSASNETYIPIEVLQRPIELTAKSAEKVWDGNVLTSPGYFISIGSLLKGHRIDSSCTIGEIYDVGTTSCFVYPDSIIIIDSAGNDVTKNYKITSKEGTLTILEPDQ